MLQQIWTSRSSQAHPWRRFALIISSIDFHNYGISNDVDPVRELFKSLDFTFLVVVGQPIPRVDHSIVKLNTTCDQKKSSFGKLHHQNGSKFYQFFFHE